MSHCKPGRSAQAPKGPSCKDRTQKPNALSLESCVNIFTTTGYTLAHQVVEKRHRVPQAACHESDGLPGDRLPTPCHLPAFLKVINNHGTCLAAQRSTPRARHYASRALARDHFRSILLHNSTRPPTDASWILGTLHACVDVGSTTLVTNLCRCIMQPFRSA